MTEENSENIFERMTREEQEGLARARENELTDKEYQELSRVQRRFEDVGDIRLSLISDWATKWSNRWNVVRNSGVLLSVVGEVTHLIGNRKGSDRLSSVGRYARNIGLATTVISSVAGGYADFEAKDAQIELVVRGDVRRR